MTDTGFKLSDGRDLIDIFETGNSGIDTNFISSAYNKDLGNIFMAGNSGIVTNYKTGTGSDLGSIFRGKIKYPFSTTGAYITGTTSSYYYAIFVSPLYNSSGTNKAPGGPVAGTVTPDPTIFPNELNFICVGGGGGGGGAYYSTTTDTSTTYNIYVGAGGIGGPPTDPGQPGGTSEIIKQTGGVSFIRCTGGIQGDGGSAGAGGVVYLYGIQQSAVINGGLGGDGTRNGGLGESSYYNIYGNVLGVDPQITSAQPAYASTCYSGGGGGSKTSTSDSKNVAGGQGGGTVSATPNTGLGGAGGLTDVPTTDGFPGNGYGSGGGAGGNESDGTRRPGGPGAQGIVICYAYLA
jgi:hypothetical protein